MKKKKLPLILFGVITGRKPICLPSTFVWKILKSFSEKWFWIELVLERFHTWVTLIWRFAFVSMLWITYALLFYDWDIFIAHPLNQGNYEKKLKLPPRLILAWLLEESPSAFLLVYVCRTLEGFLICFKQWKTSSARVEFFPWWPISRWMATALNAAITVVLEPSINAI